jgi:predicted cobalt transporter CbtA
MLRRLVICGLIAGLCGGLLAAGFGKVVGEPAIDQAIAYEQGHESSGHSHGAAADHEEPLVSRGVQSGVGLLTASLILGVSLGGLFALAFALVYGRAGPASPARTALWLGAAVFLVVFLVPFLKYPAAPPGVGDPETLGQRTLVYLSMIAISVLAAVAALRTRMALRGRITTAGATLAALVLYAVVVLVAGAAMPVVDEIPTDFPATTLWDFRVASLGMQLMLVGAIAGVFAVTASRVMAGKPIVAPRTSRPEVEST